MATLLPPPLTRVRADLWSRALPAVWVFTVAWFSAPMVTGIAGRFDELATPCRSACDGRGLGVLLPDQAVALRELGISLTAYAAFDVVREGALVVACVIVGTVMVRRVGSAAAYLAAAGLLATGAILVPETTTFVLTAGDSWITLVVATAFIVAASVFFFLLPNARWHPRWARWVVAAWVTATLAWVVVTWPTLNGLVELQFVTMLVVLAPGLAAQISRLRRAPVGVERQQAKWVLLGTGAWIGSLVLYLAVVETGVLPREAASAGYPLGYVLYGTALTATVALLPIAWSFAVLRHRLWDVDRLLGRSTLALMVTGAALTLFGLLAAMLTLLAGTRWERAVPVAALLSVAAAVPVRARVRRTVERLLYGDRGDPYDLLARLWSIAHQGGASPQQLGVLLQRLVDDLHLSAGSLNVVGESSDIVDLELGAGHGQPVTFPLSTGGRRIGTLAVWPRTGEERLSRRDLAVVQDAAAPITHVAAMVRTTEDLRRSRSDIVTAREEERTRLRHDLHDDLGPTIASQAILIDAAADALDADRSRAGDLLELARERNDHLLAEVRRLATDLRPSVLDRLGLHGALRQLTEAGDRSDLDIDLDVSLSDELPPAVETTVYRIARESLTNAIRHAEARRIAIAVRQDGTLLTLTISDDGRGGVPQGDEEFGGTGIASMTRRALELGGTLTITSLEGKGTTVALHVELP